MDINNSLENAVLAQSSCVSACMNAQGRALMLQRQAALAPWFEGQDQSTVIELQAQSRLVAGHVLNEVAPRLVGSIQALNALVPLVCASIHEPAPAAADQRARYAAQQTTVLADLAGRLEQVLSMAQAVHEGYTTLLSQRTADCSGSPDPLRRQYTQALAEIRQTLQNRYETRLIQAEERGAKAGEWLVQCIELFLPRGTSPAKKNRTQPKREALASSGKPMAAKGRDAASPELLTTGVKQVYEFVSAAQSVDNDPVQDGDCYQRMAEIATRLAQMDAGDAVLAMSLKQAEMFLQVMQRLRARASALQAAWQVASSVLENGSVSLDAQACRRRLSALRDVLIDMGETAMRVTGTWSVAQNGGAL